MKRILLIAFVTIVSSISFHIYAQTDQQPTETTTLSTDINLQQQIDNLTAQVDSLSNRLIFVKAVIDTFSIRTGLQFFNVEIENYIDDMTMQIYHNGTHRKLYDNYVELYNSAKEKLSSFKKLDQSCRVLYSTNYLTDKLTETEINVIDSSYDTINVLFERAELELDAMKGLLEFYYDNL